MIPKWSENYVPLLTIGQLNIPLPIENKQALIRKAASFVMLAGRMYNQGIDGVLRLCIEPGEAHQCSYHHRRTPHGGRPNVKTSFLGWSVVANYERRSLRLCEEVQGMQCQTTTSTCNTLSSFNSPKMEPIHCRLPRAAHIA